MKREILFKGKRIDNGEWIESMTLANVTIKRKRDWLFMQVDDDVWKQVDPKTVCQFTGLLDKNGNKIFEVDKATCEFGNFTVKFIDGCFFACFIDHIAPLYAWNNETELIGNIHD